MHENNDSRRMHNLGIFPLLILPQLPGTLTLASLPSSPAYWYLSLLKLSVISRYVAVFRLGHISSKANFVGRRTLTGATQDAIVEITATDGMTLITVKLLIYKVDVYSLRQACAVWRISSASGLCWTTVVNELKVRAVHGQLNDGGFDSQR